MAEVQTDDPGEIEIMTELKVTAKKPASFYARAAATFLRGTHSKEPVAELRVSALGGAISSAIFVAERMERDQLGKIAAIRTDYLPLQTSMCPQLSIHLLRVPPVAVLQQVEIKPECVEEFLKVATALAEGARADTGCLRFDVLRSQESSCQFLMYKVFTSATLESQKQSPHAQAMEAFQSSQPFVSNNVLQTEALNFQSQCPAPKDSPMVILFTGDVKEECIPEFLEVMGGNCRGSRGEEGCIRFDLLRAGNKFMTYEVFESNEALEVHKDKAYTKAWGAFQYGDKKPLISKSVQKFKVVDLQETELLS